MTRLHIILLFVRFQLEEEVNDEVIKFIFIFALLIGQDKLCNIYIFLNEAN